MRFTHPVLSCAAAMEWEKGLLGGDEKREWEAMTRAGRLIGREVLQDWRECGGPVSGSRILVLAGKGHNAGDAFIAAGELVRRVPDPGVDVLLVQGERGLRPLVRRAWEDLQRQLPAGSLRVEAITGRTEVDSRLDARFGETRWAVCLDGMLGMQFRPPLRQPVDAVVRWVNRRRGIGLRAAVDLPSGIGDSSAEEPFRADFTYMPGIAKAPVLAPGAAEWAGRLRYLDIGFFERAEPEAETTGGRVVTRDVLRPLNALRPAGKHKKGYGHVLLVGGSRTLPGAILMSARAALRSGAGLVTAMVPGSLVPAFAARAPEAMWVAGPETPAGGLSIDGLPLFQEAASRAGALVLGPGLGKEPEVQAFAREAASGFAGPILLDADGLTPEMLRAATSRKASAPVVLTPHAGEYARLTGQAFERGGETALRRFCRDNAAVTVLKGPPFNRITDGNALCVSFAGGPVLARGGSGDVLSGLAGGLLAWGGGASVLETVARAVFWHGAAADLLARRRGTAAVTADQVTDCLADAVRGGDRESFE